MYTYETRSLLVTALTVPVLNVTTPPSHPKVGPAKPSPAHQKPQLSKVPARTLRHTARTIAREIKGALNNLHVLDEVLDLDERRANAFELSHVRGGLR